MVDDGSSALVIDPQRDIDRLVRVLEQRAVQFAAVAETHAHNDYVSGGLELARLADVPYLVPCEADVAYERTQVCGDAGLDVGTMTVQAIDTPGHTPHHVAFDHRVHPRRGRPARGARGRRLQRGRPLRYGNHPGRRLMQLPFATSTRSTHHQATRRNG